MTKASIAYIATQVGKYNTNSVNLFSCRFQVRFALTSACVFSRTDKVTDSETFYTSIYELLHDPLEIEEVEALVAWWNKYVPSSSIIYILI